MKTPKTPAATQAVDMAHVAHLRQAGQPLFELGRVYGTTAALALLEANRLFPNALLGAHCHGDYGQVGEDDWKANDQAVVDGGRILSAYAVAEQTIWIITDAVNEDGVRRTSTLLLQSEY